MEISLETKLATGFFSGFERQFWLQDLKGTRDWWTKVLHHRVVIEITFFAGSNCIVFVKLWLSSDCC